MNWAYNHNLGKWSLTERGHVLATIQFQDNLWLYDLTKFGGYRGRVVTDNPVRFVTELLRKHLTAVLTGLDSATVDEI